MQLSDTLIEHFSNIEDPRLHNHNFRHKLSDILIIALMGTICGADGWVEIERFGEAKKDWFSSFLELANGIPSHDTFGRVFAILDPKVFEESFLAWVNSLNIDLKNEVIALDGKTVRGSGNKRQCERPIHLVSAWAAKERMMLAQVKTEDKSNEITAIPKLLDLLEIKDSTVTIDAMGCQRAITKKILSKGAHYILNLKENQKTLYDDVENIFKKAEENKEKQYKKMLHLRRVKKLKGHGRVETRKYTLVSARDPLLFQIRWPGLQGIAKVDVTRTTQHEVERSTRYYLTDFNYEQIDQFIKGASSHWQIEIDLHWSLDVAFHEDHSQVHVGNAAENLSWLRRIALNLLKKEKTHKNGIACRRKSAGWDNEYLLKVLMADRELTTNES